MQLPATSNNCLRNSDRRGNQGYFGPAMFSVHLRMSRPAQRFRVHSPFPLSVTEFGLPGSGLSATPSVPLNDFLAVGVNVTA